MNGTHFALLIAAAAEAEARTRIRSARGTNSASWLIFVIFERSSRSRSAETRARARLCCARRIGPAAAAEEAQKRARGAALIVPVGALPAS